MAGDDDADLVAAVGGTDGAGLADVAEPPGLLAVADGGPERYAPEHLPRRKLEGGAERIEGEIEYRPRSGEVLAELVGGGIENRGGIEVVPRGPRISIPWRRPLLPRSRASLPLPAHRPHPPRRRDDHELAHRRGDGGVLE